jgi:hypothetical protein
MQAFIENYMDDADKKISKKERDLLISTHTHSMYAGVAISTLQTALEILFPFSALHDTDVDCRAMQLAIDKVLDEIITTGFFG